MKKKRIILAVVSCLVVLSVTIGSFMLFRTPKAKAAESDYIQATETKGLKYSKDITDNGDGTYLLNLDTYTTETVKYIRETLYNPVDIIFVVDMSLSMNEKMDGSKGKQTRLYYSKMAMNSFLTEICDQAKVHPEALDTRLSMIRFGADAEKVFADHKKVINSNGQVNNNITAAIDDLGVPAGGTKTDSALELAKTTLDGIIREYPDESRRRIVVLFTDGNPTLPLGTIFNEGVANDALSAAKNIKNTNNTLLYCVALSEVKIEAGYPPAYDGNGQNTNNNLNRFLQYVSSCYNNANNIKESYPVTAEQIGFDYKKQKYIYQQYCYSGGNPEALTNSFQQLAQEIIIKQVISEKMDESTVLKDYITPYFELDTSKEIKVYTYNHTGKDASDNALFASEGAEYTKAQIEVKGNAVSVRNLDYEEGTVADITDVGGNVTYRGYKYSVQIPIKVKKGFLGGNDVPTNETLSGVYSDENTIGPNEKVVRWCEFPVPTVNVPVKEFTFELADKNIYANTLYKENALITDYPICKFDGGVIDFSKGNYGLEDWQNKFVEISKVKSIPIYDYFHGDGYDKTNSNGTDMYSVSLFRGGTSFVGNSSYHFYPDSIDCSATITITASDDNKQSYTATSKATVFYPEVTFADITAPAGTDIFSLFKRLTIQDYNCPVASYEQMVWKNGDTLSTTVTMSGYPNINFQFAVWTYEDKDKYCEVGRAFDDTAVMIGAWKLDEDVYATGIQYVHQKCSENEKELPNDYHFWVHANGYCKLTIQKTGSDSADVNQSHVFYIRNEDHAQYEDNEYPQDSECWVIDKYDQTQIREDLRCPNDVDMNVIVHGNESVTVILPAGTYTVMEDDSSYQSTYGGWSWRYYADASEQEVTLDANTSEATLVFNNERVNDQGLSGGSWLVNEFTGNGLVRKPQ